MRRIALVCALALLGTGRMASPALAVAAAAPIAGFSDTLVATVVSPTAIAFTADGRMLITDKGGRLRVRTASGTLVTTPALNISSRVCIGSERGLLGVAVDPDASTRAIYLFYTAVGTSSACPSSQNGGNPAGAPRNRVSRFVLGDNNIVDPASETILLDGIYTPAGNHNAGDLHVGKDGYLYVSTGDGGCDYAGNSGCGGANDATRDRNILNGKILRVVRTTGAPAPGNPFLGAGTATCRLAPAAAGAVCQETFAWGLRNPFRLAFDPDAAGTVFNINDVGQNVFEEIDRGASGADYGWNGREGHCAQTGSATDCGAAKPASMTDPIYDYGRGAGCGSITGGAFVPNGAWPASYDSAYIFGDYVCGKIMVLNGTTQTDLATAVGGAVHLAFGPYGATQALYYSTFTNGGEIHRIAYTGTANRTPTAAVTASPSSGAAPLTTTLNGSGSSDPDGDALTYLWTFGDGATATTTTATVSHTYATGSWTAGLRVRDPAGLTSASVTVGISSGNTAPTATITSPSASTLFSVGQTYQLSGSATDVQDGTLAASRLSWTILRVHDQHTHPFLGPLTGTGISFVAPGPEDLAAAANSFLRIVLTATDSQGVSSTVTRDFQPNKVAVTLDTFPVGRSMTVNGQAITGPTTVTSWAGFALQLAVPAQTDKAGRTFGFNRWSDGVGPASRSWLTPSSATTLTAQLSLRGLQGVYYNNRDFTGATVTRLDPTIGFAWGASSPVSGIGADTFSVRWTGAVLPQYTQTYTFSTTSDDAIRVWVGGKLVINAWTAHSSRVDTGTVALTSGVAAPVVIEYNEGTGNAVAQLRWSSTSQAAQLVPADRLRPYYAVNMAPSGSAVPPGYVADTGAVFGQRGSGLRYGWNASNTAQMRDRNSALSLDQRFDTLAFMQQGTNLNARWELEVPNGTYSVRIVGGDPIGSGSVMRIAAESVVVISGTTTAARWLEATATVTVTDRRLTISNASGAIDNKLSFVEVRLL